MFRNAGDRGQQLHGRLCAFPTGSQGWHLGYMIVKPFRAQGRKRTVAGDPLKVEAHPHLALPGLQAAMQ